MKRKEQQQLLNIKYRGKICPEYKEDLQRLKKGEPLDYIIGWTDFLDCKIDLSLRPLVPRNETEFWVDKVIEKCSCNPPPRTKILDLFSGSGCIGIALLKHLPNSTVHFADSEDNCLKQIEINLDLNNIDHARCKIIKSDIFSAISDKYDCIFANPPYVAEQEINSDKHEPRKALFAGPDGLKYINMFLKQAKKHLKPSGQIFMEFSPEQKQSIKNIITKNNYKNLHFNKDQYKRWRWLNISANSQ